jgi:hypothetical protein
VELEERDPSGLFWKGFGSGNQSADERERGREAHMFQRSKGKTMKWGTLLKDIKEKVGLTQSPSSTTSPASSSATSSASAAAATGGADDHNARSTRWRDSSSSSPSRFDSLSLLFSGFGFYQFGFDFDEMVCGLELHWVDCVEFLMCWF